MTEILLKGRKTLTHPSIHFLKTSCVLFSSFDHHAPINVFPQRRVVVGGWGGRWRVPGIPWGLDSQSSHYPKNLTDNFATGPHTCHKLWTEIYEIRQIFFFFLREI